MKTKLIALIGRAFVVAFAELKNQRDTGLLTADQKWQLLDISDAVEKAQKRFNELQTGILKKFGGEVDRFGRVQLSVLELTDAQFAEYTAEMEQLNGMEITLPARLQLPETAIDLLSVADIEALAPVASVARPKREPRDEVEVKAADKPEKRQPIN